MSDKVLSVEAVETLGVSVAQDGDVTLKKAAEIAHENQELAQAKRVDAEINTKGIEEKAEVGGPKGLEPTRYGDWELKGRCYDF